MKLVLVYYLVSILTKIKHPLTFNSLINKYIRIYREKIATTISLSPKKVINPVLKRFIANLYFPLLLLFFFFLTPRKGGDPPRDPRCLKFIRDRRVFRVYTSVWAVNGPTKTA